MDRRGVTVVMPVHESRISNGMYERAAYSVNNQRYPVRMEISLDLACEGAAATRQRALDKVKTEWVAFLDSDDEFLPTHVEACLAYAETFKADLVYPWFWLYQDGEWTPHDPVGRFGREPDLELLHFTNYIPVTVLARTEAVREAGGFRKPTDERPHEDWDLWVRMADMGARIVHLPQRTWIWHHHSGNTSGRPDRGDAKDAAREKDPL